MIIIYNSLTGFTEKYAKLLAKNLGFEAKSLNDYKQIPKNSEVIFLGWVYAGFIQGLKKAERKFKVKAIIAVGVSDETETTILNLAKQNKISERELFFLRGGVAIDKLKGFKKFLLSMVLKSQYNHEQQVENLSGKKMEINWLDVLQNGIDFVDEKKLKPIIQWYSDFLKNNGTNN